MVDRVYGEAFYVPLLEQWEALPGSLSPCSGDELRIGDYTYLVPVTSFSDGSFAILKVAGEQFSLLDTDHPIPMATPDGASIHWENHLIVDHSTAARLPSACTGQKITARKSWEAQPACSPAAGWPLPEGWKC